MGLCDVVSVLERGTVIAHGEPERVRRDPRVLDAYLGGALEDGESQDGDEDVDRAADADGQREASP
jgi:hypothetical protein